MGSSGRPWTSAMGSYLTMGIQLALPVVIFALLGRWLDEKYGTSPWLLLAGLAFGAVGGFVKFFSTAVSMGRKANQEAKERKKGERGED